MQKTLTDMQQYGGPRGLMLFSMGLLALTSLAAAEPPPADVLNPPPQAEVRPSGLATMVMVPGGGEHHPDENDHVSIEMKGWSTDGNQFENTEVSGGPVVFKLDSVFPAWREGLQLMVRGEHRRLWIPAKLAPRTAGSRGAALFDVELKGILKIPNPPEERKAPEKAERTPSGARTLVVTPAAGGERPGADSKVLLHYTVWTAGGKTVDSTYERRKPTLFFLDKVMPAFAEGVQMMAVGETRRFWIPGFVADGQWPGAPDGDLIFEVTLLQIAAT